MKKSLTLLTVTMLCVAVVLSACGGGAGSGSGDVESDGQIVIKISHQNASTHPVHLGLLYFKELIEEASGGAMTADIYDSSVLGDDSSNLQQVAAGTLDCAMIMGVSIWQGFDSRAGIEEVPFLFNSFAEARAAWDGEFGGYVSREIIEAPGLKCIDFWENGFRHFTNNKQPVVVPADMAGIKFRTAESEIRVAMFEELNASAIVMAFSELYSAMQQGTVDGQENPLSNIVASSFYEVQEYLSLSGHIYNTSVFIMSDSFWNSLSEEQQGIIRQASAQAKQHTREINESMDEEYLQQCVDGGMQVNEIDTQAFVEAVQPVWDLFTEKHGPELIDLALAS